MSKYIIFRYVDDSTTLIFASSCETLTDAINAYHNLQIENIVFIFDSENQKVMSDDLIEYIFEQTKTN